MSREFLFFLSVFVGGAIVIASSWDWLMQPLPARSEYVRLDQY